MAEENPPTPPPAQPTGSAYTQGEKITKINVADEIKNSFLDYSMSVIISRALPDVRDGLKPSDRKSTRLNSSHSQQSRMPSSA